MLLSRKLGLTLTRDHRPRTVGNHCNYSQMFYASRFDGWLFRHLLVDTEKNDLLILNISVLGDYSCPELPNLGITQCVIIIAGSFHCPRCVGLSGKPRWTCWRVALLRRTCWHSVILQGKSLLPLRPHCKQCKLDLFFCLFYYIQSRFVSGFFYKLVKGKHAIYVLWSLFSGFWIFYFLACVKENVNCISACLDYSYILKMELFKPFQRFILGLYVGCGGSVLACNLDHWELWEECGQKLPYLGNFFRLRS